MALYESKHLTPVCVVFVCVRMSYRIISEWTNNILYYSVKHTKTSNKTPSNGMNNQWRLKGRCSSYTHKSFWMWLLFHLNWLHKSSRKFWALISLNIGESKREFQKMKKRGNWMETTRKTICTKLRKIWSIGRWVAYNSFNLPHHSAGCVRTLTIRSLFLFECNLFAFCMRIKTRIGTIAEFWRFMVHRSYSASVHSWKQVFFCFDNTSR